MDHPSCPAVSNITRAKVGIARTAAVTVELKVAGLKINKRGVACIIIIQ